MRALSVRRRDSELPQWGLVHRHRGVPAVVVPFFFIGPVHTGHRGRFVVTGESKPAAPIPQVGALSVY